MKTQIDIHAVTIAIYLIAMIILICRNHKLEKIIYEKNNDKEILELTRKLKQHRDWLQNKLDKANNSETNPELEKYKIWLKNKINSANVKLDYVKYINK